VDADIRILSPIQFEQDVFEPGLRAFGVFSWQHMKDVRMAGEPAWWKSQNLRMMPILKKYLKLEQTDQDIYLMRESLFSVTRSENIYIFLQKWNDLAEFCEKNRFWVHLGVSMGLAALLTGYPLYHYEFPGLQFFEPSKSLEDVTSGMMTQAEYDSLNASIENLKSPAKKGSSILPNLWRKRITKGVRYIRVKLFGLDLLR
jgi:hypothetical protein